VAPGPRRGQGVQVLSKQPEVKEESRGGAHEHYIGEMSHRPADAKAVQELDENALEFYLKHAQCAHRSFECTIA